jgi:hypothetical protein
LGEWVGEGGGKGEGARAAVVIKDSCLLTDFLELFELLYSVQGKFVKRIRILVFVNMN